MKAAVYQGRGAIHKIEVVPDPEPGPRDIVLKVSRCGICGSDLSLTAPDADTGPYGPFIQQLYSPGAILGHELIGEVVEVGGAVEGFSVGDLAAPLAMKGCGACLDCLRGKPLWCSAATGVNGGFAQYARADASFSVSLPRSLSPEAGALIEPLAASLHGVSVGHVWPGAKVLIFGAGTLGLGMAFFARRYGAGRVCVVARTRDGEAVARSVGADTFLRNGPTIVNDVLDSLSGPPDIVLEAAGAPGVVNAAIACVKPYGTVAIAGFHVKPEAMDHATATMKELSIRYVAGYDLTEFRATRDGLVAGDIPAAPFVSASIALQDFPTKFESLRAQRSPGRTQVVPWE
jgi:2-desacetyl-2-hydroxyethyl bacteriochlorophyllide A dehydrogenase